MDGDSAEAGAALDETKGKGRDKSLKRPLLEAEKDDSTGPAAGNYD